MTQETVKPFKKSCRLGTTKVGKRNGSVYVKIEWDGKSLSITGVVGPLPSGNALGSCGHFEHPIQIETYAQGWTAWEIQKLWALWDRWHLNDMRAGCEHQRALGWTKYDDHPSEPCPTCGYKYGTAWLTEEVPQDVLEWLAELPRADKPCPWNSMR